jgi:RsiW-degrading membrane proteinase PrsW (M82 family)
MTGLILICLGGAAWVSYFRREDLGPCLLVSIWGCLSVSLALLGYQIMGDLGFSVTWDGLYGNWEQASETALAVGFVEESAKFIPVIWVVFFGYKITKPVYGVVFAAMSGIGFATIESGMLLLGDGLSLPKLFARAAVAPLVHASFLIPSGVGLWKTIEIKRVYPVILGFTVSVVTHGAYDLFLAKSEGKLYIGSTAIVLAICLWTVYFTDFRESNG